MRRMDMPHLFIMPGAKAGNRRKPIAIVLDEQAATRQDRSPSRPNFVAMTSTGVLEKC